MVKQNATAAAIHTESPKTSPGDLINPDRDCKHVCTQPPIDGMSKPSSAKVHAEKNSRYCAGVLIFWFQTLSLSSTPLYCIRESSTSAINLKVGNK